MGSDDSATRQAGELARSRVARAQAALELLSAIDDPEAAAPLRRVVEGHAESRVRAAALRSLGRSGDEGDVATAARALDASDEGERSAAIAALGELGGQVAADGLATRLEIVTGDELEQVVAALAWLCDRRALGPARRLGLAALDSYQRDHRNPVWALVRIGEDADRNRLRERVGAMPKNFGAPHQAFWTLRNALASEDEAAARDFSAAFRLTEARSARLQTVQPLGARTVPRLTLSELLDEPADNDAPHAKFGGQPDWIGTPAWPHTSAGRPLVFYGQLPLLGEPRRTAYIFIGPGASWEPLGEGNALVVQPGPVPTHIDCRPRTTGPRIYEYDTAPCPARFHAARRYRPYERFARLAEGADPERWEWPETPPGVYRRDDHGDWNKVGGTGLWLQGDPRLRMPGEGWQFAFQFTADWAAQELGDGAECYGFVRDDGTAAFAWDCH